MGCVFFFVFFLSTLFSRNNIDLEVLTPSHKTLIEQGNFHSLCIVCVVNVELPGALKADRVVEQLPPEKCEIRPS